MNLFFQIQSLQLLIFCIDDQEFVANLDYILLFVFSITSSKLIIFCIVLLYFITLHYSLLWHLLNLCFCSFHIYICFYQIDSFLLLSFELKVIWSMSSVKILCLSLLNLCCVFNVDQLFFMNCLWLFWDYMCQFCFL